MSVEQTCNERGPGTLRRITVDGPQLCSPQPSGRADRYNNAPVTDECGQPIPGTCLAQEMDYPTCYTDPNAPPQYVGCVLPGFRRETIAANCGVTDVEILTTTLVTVPGAIEVICPSRSSLPGQPVN